MCVKVKEKMGKVKEFIEDVLAVAGGFVLDCIFRT